MYLFTRTSKRGALQSMCRVVGGHLQDKLNRSSKFVANRANWSGELATYSAEEMVKDLLDFCAKTAATPDVAGEVSAFIDLLASQEGGS